MKIIFFLLIFSQCAFAQTPKPFKTCSKTVNYTVDDYVLRKKVGMDLHIPVSNPSYFGGVNALKKIFAANPIDNSIYMFRTSICFVVNCKGQIGDFQFLVDGKVEERQKQVLDKVKKMSGIWKPAISKDGKPVDSYQVITLTTKGSEIIDVEYR